MLLELRAKFQNLILEKLNDIPMTSIEDHLLLVSDLTQLMNIESAQDITLKCQPYTTDILSFLQKPELYVQVADKQEFIGLVKECIAQKIVSLRALVVKEKQPRFDSLESNAGKSEKKTTAKIHTPASSGQRSSFSSAADGLMSLELIDKQTLQKLNPKQYKVVTLYLQQIYQGTLGLSDIINASEVNLTSLFQAPLKGLLEARCITVKEALALTSAELNRLKTLGQSQIKLLQILVQGGLLKLRNGLELTKSDWANLQRFNQVQLNFFIHLVQAECISLQEIISLTAKQGLVLQRFSQVQLAQLSDLVENGYLKLTEILDLPQGECERLHNLSQAVWPSQEPSLTVAQYKMLSQEEKRLVLVPGIAKLLAEADSQNRLKINNLRSLPLHVKQLLLEPLNRELIYSKDQLQTFAKIPSQYMAYSQSLNIQLLGLVVSNVIELETALSMNSQQKEFSKHAKVIALIKQAGLTLEQAMQLSSQQIAALNDPLINELLEAKQLTVSQILTLKPSEAHRLTQLSFLFATHYAKIETIIALPLKEIRFIQENRVYFSAFEAKYRLDITELSKLSLEQRTQLQQFYQITEPSSQVILPIQVIKNLDQNELKLFKQIKEFAPALALTLDKGAKHFNLNHVLENHVQQPYWRQIVNLYQQRVLDIKGLTALLLGIENDLFSIMDVKIIFSLAKQRPNLFKNFTDLNYQSSQLFKTVQDYKQNHALEILQEIVKTWLKNKKINLSVGKKVIITTSSSKFFVEKAEIFNQYLEGVIRYINSCQTTEQIISYLQRTEQYAQGFQSLNPSYRQQFSELIGQARLKANEFLLSINDKPDTQFKSSLVK